MAMVSIVPRLLQSLCVFGLTLEDALNMPEAVGPRDVDVVELWCGVGSIVAAASAAGHVVRKFDKHRVPGVTDTEGRASEDLLSSCGFMSAVHCVLAIRTGGLLWMAPVCSSFVFMNSSKCKRRVGNWMGDVNYKPVAEGNLHATVAAFLFALARLRGVSPVLENPSGSVIFRFPVLQLVLSYFSIAKSICCRCAFSTERMGRRWKKAYKLVGNAWVSHLAAPCRCKNGLHCSLVHRVICSKSYNITGRKDALRGSAAYPLRMGKFVIRQWMRHSSGESAAENRQGKKDPGAMCVIRPLSTVTTGSAWKAPTLHTGSLSHSTSKAQDAWKNLPLHTPSGASSADTVSKAWRQMSFTTSPTSSSASSTSESQAAVWKTPCFESTAPTEDTLMAWKTPEF